jgi:Fe2+ or Zn2+ uptake regulation protein
MEKKFICDMCGNHEECSDDWTEEKRMKEALDNGFGHDLVKGDCQIVCDDCYNKAMTELNFFNPKGIEA